MTKKELEPKQSAAVGVVNEFSDFPDTMCGRDQLGNIIPRYFFKGDRGEFVYNLDPSIVKSELEVVILGGKGSRAYFAHEYDPENIEAPICRSADGVVPETGSSPDGATMCKDCTGSVWAEDPKTGKKRSPCMQCYDLLCIEVENGAPFILSFKRTGMAPLKRYQTMMGVSGRPAWSIVTTIGSEQQMYGTREYYVPTLTKLRDMELDEAKPYFDMWTALNGQFTSQAPEFDEGEDAVPTTNAGDPFDFDKTVADNFPNGHVVNDDEPSELAD